jgi:hypothetical protein
VQDRTERPSMVLDALVAGRTKNLDDISSLAQLERWANLSYEYKPIYPDVKHGGSGCYAPPLGVTTFTSVLTELAMKQFS